MKGKIVAVFLVLSLCFAAGVSAATLWGTYKGNSIIRLTVDGTPVKVSDVPAISYNNRTMIPIYLLQQAGINYTWDQKTQTVNIVTSKPTSQQQQQTTQVQPQTSTLELYSFDGKTYLGKLTTNKYDTDSVFNQYGNYGSEYSVTSIWNEYGNYGSKYSNTSAFNELATEPPVVYENDVAVGYITANTTIEYGIHPNDLYSFLSENGW